MAICFVFIFAIIRLLACTVAQLTQPAGDAEKYDRNDWQTATIYFSSLDSSSCNLKKTKTKQNIIMA